MPKGMYSNEGQRLVVVDSDHGDVLEVVKKFGPHAPFSQVQAVCVAESRKRPGIMFAVEYLTRAWWVRYWWRTEPTTEMRVALERQYAEESRARLAAAVAERKRKRALNAKTSTRRKSSRRKPRRR